MNCSDAEQLFDAYLDGELSGALRLEFDAHRLRCGVCQKKIAMLESFEFVVASDDRTPTISDDFTDRVMASLGSRPVRLARRRRVAIGSAVALQAAAVIVFAILWRSSASTSPSVVPGERVSPELEVAMNDPTGAELKRYMFSELMRSVQNSIENGVGGLPRYAWNLTIPRELFETPGPFNSMLESLLPAAPEKPEPAPDDAPSGRVPL